MRGDEDYNQIHSARLATAYTGIIQPLETLKELQTLYDFLSKGQKHTPGIESKQKTKIVTTAAPVFCGYDLLLCQETIGRDTTNITIYLSIHTHSIGSF